MINWIISNPFKDGIIIALVMALGSSIYMFNDKKSDPKRRHNFAYLQLIFAVAIVFMAINTLWATAISIALLVLGWMFGGYEHRREQKVLMKRIIHMRFVRRVLKADPELNRRFQASLKKGIIKANKNHKRKRGDLFVVKAGKVGKEVDRRAKELQESENKHKVDDK